MRLAAVDIGSNTVHSLVADVVRGKLEDVAHYVEEPELGPYVARTGAIGSRSKVAIQALRSVVEPGGQRIDASNRLYLAQHIPFLLAWGEHDAIIPVSHGHAAHWPICERGFFAWLCEPRACIPSPAWRHDDCAVSGLLRRILWQWLLWRPFGRGLFERVRARLWLRLHR